MDPVDVTDVTDVTWTSMEELKKDMGYFDPVTMCLRVTLPGKGLPAGWHLCMSKKDLAETLREAYLKWPGEVVLRFEAPPPVDEFEGLSPRSAEGVRLANASYTGDLSKVQHLLDQKVDPNLRLRVKGRNSALNMAGRGGFLDVVKLLLSIRADPNSRNDFQETPLLCAANRARGDVCRLLLLARADPLAVDENGDNALDFLGGTAGFGDSERKKHCREILQAAGCRR